MAERMAVEPIASEARCAVDRIVAESEVPGVSLAIRLDGDVTFELGVGHEHPDGDRPLDPIRAFPLYSVTKTILATAVMRLVDEAQLSLDESIAGHLSDYPLDSAITVRDLLNHTSGLPDYGALPDYSHDVRHHPGMPWSDRDFYDRTMAQGMQFESGAGWGYSNLGYMLVRLLIERVTGHSLRDALNLLVFAPLGLRHTRVVATADALAELAPGYSSQLDEDGVRRLINGRFHPGWVAHGLVASSAAETAQLLDALFSGSLVSRGSLMQTLDSVPVPVQHPFIREPGYGLGLMIDLASPFGDVAGHAGGGPGFSTAAFHFLDVEGHRLTVAAIANSEAGDIATRIAFETAMTAQQVLSSTPD